MEGFTVVAPTEPDLLLAEANKMDVDVLCFGGTHRFDAYDYMDKFFVNPGSATGAPGTSWVADGEEVVPSFCLMDVGLTLFAMSGADNLSRSYGRLTF
jgi:vacuolar protein sorting-associated protein 29